MTIPAGREKIKVKLALAIATGAPTTLVNEQIDTPPVIALKQLKSCLRNQKQLHIYLFLFIYLLLSLELTK